MKTKIFVLSVLGLIISTNKSYTQSESAVWFLNFPVSPSQNAMGYTGTSLPIYDPYGFLLNPAQLGYTSKQNNLSLMIYPSDVKLWGIDEFRIKGEAVNIGFNFTDLLEIPISLGFGYSNQKLELNYNLFPFEGEQDEQKYQAYSAGVGFDYYLEFYAGVTYKNINSIINPPIFSSVLSTYEAKQNTWDFGFMIKVPVVKLVDKDFKFEVLNKNTIKPYFDLSFGYSKLNIGDEIYYVDPAQSDPLPRTARLGYGVSTGVDIIMDKSPIKFLGFDFTVDAEDLLYKYRFTETGEPSIPIIRVFDGYQSFLGDINIWKNIIQIKGDDNVIAHAGGQFNFLESFIVKFGHVTGKSLNNTNTKGFEVRSKGMLKLLSEFTNNSIVTFISKHFDIRYYNSNYIAGENFETNMKGIAIYIQNLNSLF